jgi:hypothetical protein
MNGRNKWLIAIIVILALINAATIGSFWLMRKPPHPPKLEKILEKELSLTPEQTAQFRKLDDTHRSKAMQLRDSLTLYTGGLFDEMLSDNPNQTVLDSINVRIGAIHIKMDKNLVQHYNELKVLCTSPEQKEKLKAIFKKITKRPPPRK